MFNLENNFKPVLAAKTNRAIVISCLILQLASACSPKSETPQTNLSSPTPIVVTLTPTAKPKISAIIDSPYPTSQEGFNLNAGGADPEERIKSMGAGTDIAVMKGQYIAEMNRSGIEPDKTEFVFGLNELAASSSWTLMVRDSTGQFFWPKITTGPDAGMLERSGNLAKYLNRDFGDDYFDLIPLNFPKGLGKTEQRLVQDKSGWFVMGGFLKGEIVVWFDADKDEWIPANSFKPEGSEVVLEEDKWVAKVKGDVVSTFDPQKGEWVKKEVWELPKICTDWREIDPACKVTLEDITSGRLTEAAKIAAKKLGKESFPPEAYAVGDKFMIDNSMPQLSNIDFNTNGFSSPFYLDFISHPEKRPYRWVFYNQIELPGFPAEVKLIQATQQWLNPSGKISYLHYFTYNRDSINEIIFEKMYCGFPYIDVPIIRGKNDPTEKFLPDQETKQLLSEWVNTGEVPDQLQYKSLFPIIISKGKMYYSK